MEELYKTRGNNTEFIWELVKNAPPKEGLLKYILSKSP